MNGQEAKERFWAHWDDLQTLCGRRFPRDANLAEEASRYVLDKLEADDWRRVRTWEGQGHFKTFLTVVVNRLLSDFHKQRFGYQRPPKWLKEEIDREHEASEQGRATPHPGASHVSFWQLAYQVLYRDKYSRQEAIERLLTQESSPSRERVEQIVTMILARCPPPIVSPDAPKQPLDELGEVKSEQPDPLENCEREERHRWEEWLASLLENGTSSTAQPAREPVRQLQGLIHWTEEDRMFLRLRFAERLAVPTIARMLGLRGDPYKHLGRLLDDLGKAFRQVGVSFEVGEQP